MVEGGLWYDVMGCLFLVSIGTYHMYSATTNHLLLLLLNKQHPHNHNYTYAAKPYHPLILNFNNNNNTNSNSLIIIIAKVSRHIQLYLTMGCLTVALIHQLILSSEPDPLLRGRSPVHLLTSLQSSSVILLFLLLSLSLLLFSNPPDNSSSSLPNDLFFALASVAFYLDYFVSSSSSSSSSAGGLQSECDSLSARISALSSLLCLLLACFPRLFVADLALGASLCLQGMWTLQTGLSLHVDSFIPLGCHKLLDVVSGVEGSTKCDLDDSRLRAVALLDLLFLVHVLIVVLLVIIVYAASSSSKASSADTTTTHNGVTRRFGSYEALPTTTTVASSSLSANVTDSSHIQMKALAGTQA